jgi:type I restriction enzyme S subunit
LKPAVGWKLWTLEELVQGGVVELGRGKVISKSDLKNEPGAYPVYSSAREGDGKFGEYGRYNFDEELITWSVDGGGRLFHRLKHRFSVTNVGGFLRIKKLDVLSYRYLYFALTLEHSRIAFDWVKKAHPSTLRREYKSIPIPSLIEQERIVAALDEAFIATAVVTKNLETNIFNARQLFDCYLNKSFADGSRACSHHVGT